MEALDSNRNDIQQLSQRHIDKEINLNQSQQYLKEDRTNSR